MCIKDIKKIIKNIAVVTGAVLWIGALSPEIFVNLGDGCILDENGEALTAEEAETFMKSYFYRNNDDSKDKVKLKYKFAITQIFD